MSSGSPAPAARVRADRSAPLVVAIDSSGPVEVLALVQGQLPLAQLQLRKERGSGRSLADSLNRMLALAERTPTDLAAVCVISGPGSFTGLRVGLALACGLGDALKIPVFAYPSILGWAYAVGASVLPVAVTLDARRGEVYTALLRLDPSAAPELLQDSTLLSPEAWLARLEEIAPQGAVMVGDGAVLYDGIFEGQLEGKLSLASPIPAGPDLSKIAFDGVHRLLSGETDAERPTPIYLRGHDGQNSRKRAAASI